MSEASADPRRQSFGGSVGRTVGDSVPWWPARRPGGRRGRPNVVVILLDDVGFAQLGCYGSSIATPNIDALAAGGVRYTNFHATALCSPTRASLLTGRNHHAVGMGFLAAFDTGFPSYRGEVTPAAATVGEVLRGAGYGTYAVGKWHLTPPKDLTPAGPFDQWPTQRGFDRYYGFLWGEDDQWEPELWHDQHRVEPPGDPDYHLSEDLVRRAEEFVSDHRTARPDDPFFLYLCFGACHAPHQAPRRYIDAYRGAFDHGWDEERERVLARQRALGIVPPDTALAPRNPGVAAWDELPPERRSLYARMQEVFAGFMTHTDDQVGHLVEFLRRNALLDDTVVLLMSDNGASGEGGEHGTANEYRWFLRLPDPVEETMAAASELGGRSTHNHYPTGWAQAGNTPLKYYKRHAYGGGVRVPLIVHWPAGVPDSPPTRHQFHHVIDVAPTLYELCGVTPPEVFRGVPQLPMHGTSMAYTFGRPDAPTTRRVQYFETAGHRGIYSDGWKAVARHEPGTDFDGDHWELFDLRSDFAECRDLSGEQPGLAQRMCELWWREAERYAVLPLDDRMQVRMTALDPAEDRLRYEMLPRTRLLNGLAGPNFSARRFRIRAEVAPWEPGDDGALLAWGRRAAGLAFFVQDGRLTVDLNLAGDHTVVAGAEPVTPGATALDAVLDAPGGEPVIRLLVDGTVVAEAAVPMLIPAGMGTLSTQCGENWPSPVSRRYDAPFRYRGTLHRVVIDLEPREPDDGEADWLAALGQQ